LFWTVAAVLVTAVAAAGVGFLPRARPPVIRGIQHEDQIAGAVGFVVCGEVRTLPDGTRLERPSSTGSCFAVSRDGYLLTNKHVVESTWKLQRAPILAKIKQEKLIEIVPQVWVFFGKQKHAAEIVHVSDNFDLSVLKVDRSHTPFFRLAGAEKLPRGTRVFACGFPGAARDALGFEERIAALVKSLLSESDTLSIEQHFKARDFEFGMTGGTVSRVVAEEMDRKWVQHDASINPGNSGGPLLSEDGTVVGINTVAAKEGKGIYYSISMPQLRQEVDKHIPGAVWD
jgi:serine protease Do